MEELSRRRNTSQSFVHCSEGFGGQGDAGGSGVVFDLRRPGRAADDAADIGPAQAPGEGKLGHRKAEAGGNRSQLLNAGQGDIVEAAAAEEHILGRVSRPAAFGQRLAGLVFAGQNPLSERRKDNLPETFALTHGNDFGFDTAPQQAVIGLIGNKRMQVVAADIIRRLRDLRGAPFGDAGIQNFALTGQVV